MEPFKFKQFSIHQDRVAMKVGTDGVLLGAWTSLNNAPNSILDIGAGTGLIALMLAQRGHAKTIDALEVDEPAYEQCVENFEASPWADRLFCYHAGLEEFIHEVDDSYDLIVSNPPFYSEGVSSGNRARDRARQSQALPFSELVESVSKLLAQEGTFSTIIPYKEEDTFILLAADNGLFPQRITRVKGNPSTGFKRSLLAFGFDATKKDTAELIIEKERHRYTDEYVLLTKDFYLNM